MPGTPIDSPAATLGGGAGHFQLAQANFPPSTPFQQHYQQAQLQDADMNHTPRAAVGVPPPPPTQQPIVKPSLGMMEDDFPVRTDPVQSAAARPTADASFSSTGEAEPYLSWFYGS